MASRYGRTGAMALLGMVLLASPAGAQTSTGRVIGRVVDAAQGTPIAGAVVVLVSSAKTQATALDGRYVLRDVPAGDASIRVRMIGYRSKVVTGIRVVAGQATAQDIALEVTTIELEEISVTSEAERGSVSRALDEQRTAVGVVNAVSAEQISRSPDGDAGQAIQRVSGVTVQDGKYIAVRGLGQRYTTTQLNGARLPSPDPEKKVVPLDLFPSGLLASISTTKIFTPDQWGDFSGAQVNLTTRDFPARRQFSVSLSSGLNTAATGKDIIRAPRTGSEWLGLAGSARALPAPLVGVRTLSGRSDADINGMIASFRNAWAPVSGTGSANQSVSLVLGGSGPMAGLDFGYVGSFSYGYSQEARANEVRALPNVEGDSLVPIDQYSGSTGRSSVLWGGLLNLTTHFGTSSKISFNNSYSRSADNEANQLAGFNEEFATPLILSRLTFTARSVRSDQLTGEHLLGERHTVDWSVTSSRVTRDEPDRSDLSYIGTPDPVTGELARGPWFAGEFSATKTFSTLTENGWDFAGNYRLALGSLRKPVMLKAGVAYRIVDRDADSQPYDVQNRNLSLEERSVAPSQLFDGTYAMDGRLTLFVDQVGGQYTARDRVTAGYAMLDVPVGQRLHVIGGGRVERWALDLTSWDRTLSRDSTVLRRNTDLLPALALNYMLAPDQNLRFAASQTLSRPEYREITNVQSFNPIDGTFLFGNTSLQRARIQNYDLRWEWFPREGEVVSLGVFAKRFSDPIERVFVFTSGAAALSYINGASATDVGAEIEFRKRLDTLAPGLRDFTLFSNITLMRSRITPGDSSLTSTERPLVGQAGYIVNAGLSYSHAGWSGTVLYNLVGRRIAEAGFRPYPDVYEEPRHLLDLSLEVPVFNAVALKLNGKNLLDSRVRFTQGTVDRLTYRAGRVFSLGAQWHP